MRLLEVNELKLYTFYGDATPKYAILSHNWLRNNEEEVTFQQIQNLNSCRKLPGFRKIELLCREAKKSGYKYAWIDTCCIDKTNNSELSEAINSMFAWYEKAAVCYAYFTDISSKRGDNFLKSRWWTRAWTLQELLAPNQVVFFDCDWRKIGTKSQKGIVDKIATQFSIDERMLVEPYLIFHTSIAQRLSWAANREATRTEDLAYCLLGLCKINIPMQYGEGYAAFVRLQREILKSTNDQTLFAWSFSTQIIDKLQKEAEKHGLRDDLSTNGGLSFSYGNRHGIFASHPRYFEGCQRMGFLALYASDAPVAETNGALHMQIPLIKLDAELYEEQYIGLLACTDERYTHSMIGILLERYKEDRFKRICLKSDIFTFRVPSRMAQNAKIETIWIDDRSRIADSRFKHWGPWSTMWRDVVVNVNGCPLEKLTSKVFTNGAEWDDAQSTLRIRNAGGLQTDRMGMSLDIHPSLQLSIALALRNPKADNDQVLLSQGPDSMDFALGLDPLPETADSRDVLHSRKYTVKAKVQSRRIFNHLITTLSIELKSIESMPSRSSLTPRIKVHPSRDTRSAVDVSSTGSHHRHVSRKSV